MFSFVETERSLFNFNSLSNFSFCCVGDDFYGSCVFKVSVVSCLVVALGLG